MNTNKTRLCVFPALILLITGWRNERKFQRKLMNAHEPWSFYGSLLANLRPPYVPWGIITRFKGWGAPRTPLNMYARRLLVDWCQKCLATLMSFSLGKQPFKFIEHVCIGNVISIPEYNLFSVSFREMFCKINT